MKGRTVNMEIKNALWNSIKVPTLTDASEIWTWSDAQKSRIEQLR